MRFHHQLFLLATLFPALAAPALTEGPAHLVADLNPGTDSFNASLAPASFGSYTMVHGRVVFFGFVREGSPFLNAYQCGLWATDGSAGGTERLADLCGEADDLNNQRPRMLGTTGAVAFLTDLPGRLWRTDGTAAGTYPLGDVLAGDQLLAPAVVGPDGRTLFFQGCTPARGCEPWRSDGTVPGTAPLGDLAPGAASSLPAGFTVFGQTVIFTALGGLWSTAGTPQSTVPLVRFASTQALGKPLPHGGLIYFFAFTALESDLWVYDPQARKARKLHAFPFDFFEHAGASLAEAGGRLLISQFDLDAGTASLWESDGTRAGTRQLGPPRLFGGVGEIFDVGGKALFLANRSGGGALELWSLAPGMKRPLPVRGCPGGCPAPEPGGPAAVFNGRLFFTASDAQHGRELWSTDGTGAGTRLAADLCPGPCDGGPVALRAAAGHLVLVDTKGDLWATDGAPAGTSRLAPTPSGAVVDGRLDLAALGGRIVFTGLDPEAGPQPFASDFTPGGTEPAATIGPGLAASSSPSALSTFDGGKVLFEACDASTGGLWSSDGTPAGTFLLPGTEIPCELGRPSSIIQWLGGIALFDWKGKLWRTDGTANGTVPILDLPTQPFTHSRVVLGNELLFVLDPPADTPPSTTGYDWTFWTSDGTPGGTREVFALHLGGAPDPLVAVGGLAYFTASAPTAPYPVSLWRTDGTAAGTFPILANTGGGGFGAESARLDGKTWLILITRDLGYEIWSTDGTAAGTAPLLPGTAGPRPRNPYSLIAFQGALYFWADSGDAAHPVKGLWRSDGTAAGTRLVKAIDPPHSDQVPGGFLPPELTAVGSQLFFRADDGAHGSELWKTDGTPAGTVLVKDIAPGPATSRLDDLTAAAGKLYFGATDDEHGFELWESDGTAAGTRLVQDIQPGPTPSNPEELTVGDGVLYFTANDGEHGRELWALPLPR